MYSTRVLRPMPTATSYQAAPQSAGVSLLPALPSNSSSRVTVNTVIKRRPVPVPAPSPLPVLSELRTALSPQSSSHSAISPIQSSTSTSRSVPISTSPPATTPLASEPLIAKSPATNKTTVKKDLMSTLFVPKHKAYSQRPV